MPTHLTSLQNQLVKEIVRLRDRQYRDRTGLTIVEGRVEITRALEAGLHFSDLFYCEKMLGDDYGGELYSSASKSCDECFSVSERVYEKVAFGGRREGLIATVKIPATNLTTLTVPASPLLLVVEGVEKPGNLGALFRSADAAGVDAVIVCEPRTDLFNPNAVRASLGTIFTVPLVQSTNEEALKWLTRNHIQTLAAAPNGSIPYTSADFTTPCAIVLGTEHEGLSEHWTSASNQIITIPMRGRADSLNLAMAATVIAFEAVRQRR